MNRIQQTVCFLLLSSALCSIASAEPVNSDPPPLQAQTDDDKGHDPLPLELRAGHKFSKEALNRITRGKPIDVWVRIPEWMAGRWDQTSMTSYFTRDYRTGLKDTTAHELANDHVAVLLGCQRDAEGNIWHHQNARVLLEPMLSNGIDLYGGSQSWRLEEVAPGLVAISISEVELLVDHATGVITKGSIVDSYATLTAPAANTLKWDSVQRFYDEMGVPVMTNKATALMERRQPFASVDDDHGINLKELFSQYQCNHGTKPLKQ